MFYNNILHRIFSEKLQSNSVKSRHCLQQKIDSFQGFVILELARIILYFVVVATIIVAKILVISCWWTLVGLNPMEMRPFQRTVHNSNPAKWNKVYLSVSYCPSFCKYLKNTSTVSLVDIWFTIYIIVKYTLITYVG